jgi:hypothetical protein
VTKYGQDSSTLSASNKATVTVVLTAHSSNETELLHTLQALLDSLLQKGSCGLLPGYTVTDMTLGNAIPQPTNKELMNDY